MTKIKIPHSRDFEHLFAQAEQRIVPVTGVEVRCEPDSGALISLELEIPRSNSLVVPLSPPASMQLSRALHRAVKDYLGEPEKPGKE